MKVMYRILVTFLLINLSLPVFADDMYINDGDYKKAYIYYNNLLSESKSAINYLNMCWVTFKLNDSNTAKFYCNRALDLLDQKKYKDNELKSDVLGMLGYIYSGTHNTKIPFDYYNEAKVIKESNPDTDKFELARLYLNMGYAYAKSSEYDFAEEYLNKAIETAKDYPENKIHILTSSAYNNLSSIALKRNNYKLAEKYINIALEEINHTENIRYKAIINHTKYAIYYYLKDKKNSLDALFTSQDLFNEAFYKDSELIYMYKEPSDTELNELIKKFPYDNMGNYYMLIKNLTEGNDEGIDKYLNSLLNVDNNSSLRLYYIASAFTKAYNKTKNLAYSQRAKMYIKQFLNYGLNKYNHKTLCDVSALYLELNEDRLADKNFKKAINVYEIYGENKAELYLSIARIYYNFYKETKQIKYAKKADKYMQNSIDEGQSPKM